MLDSIVVEKGKQESPDLLHLANEGPAKSHTDKSTANAIAYLVNYVTLHGNGKDESYVRCFLISDSG